MQMALQSRGQPGDPLGRSGCADARAAAPKAANPSIGRPGRAAMDASPVFRMIVCLSPMLLFSGCATRRARLRRKCSRSTATKRRTRAPLQPPAGSMHSNGARCGHGARGRGSPTARCAIAIRRSSPAHGGREYRQRRSRAAGTCRAYAARLAIEVSAPRSMVRHAPAAAIRRTACSHVARGRDCSAAQSVGVFFTGPSSKMVRIRDTPDVSDRSAVARASPTNFARRSCNAQRAPAWQVHRRRRGRGPARAGAWPAALKERVLVSYDADASPEPLVALWTKRPHRWSLQRGHRAQQRRDLSPCLIFERRDAVRAMLTPGSPQFTCGAHFMWRCHEDGDRRAAASRPVRAGHGGWRAAQGLSIMALRGRLAYPAILWC